jgi:hypothetical protein
VGNRMLGCTSIGSTHASASCGCLQCCSLCALHRTCNQGMPKRPLRGVCLLVSFLLL